MLETFRRPGSEDRGVVEPGDFGGGVANVVLSVGTDEADCVLCDFGVGNADAVTARCLEGVGKAVPGVRGLSSGASGILGSLVFETGNDGRGFDGGAIGGRDGRYTVEVMVAVAVIPWRSVVGRQPAAFQSVVQCRRAAVVAGSVGSSRSGARVVHYLVHTTSQRTSPSLCRAWARRVGVSVGSAGMSHSETLETPSRGRAGWAWCFDGAGLPLPIFCGAGVTGASSSQCTYGEHTQEQAARSAASVVGSGAGAQRSGCTCDGVGGSGQSKVDD